MISKIKPYRAYIKSRTVSLLGDTLGCDTLAILNLGDELLVVSNVGKWSRVSAEYYDHSEGSMWGTYGVIRRSEFSESYHGTLFEAKNWVRVPTANIRSGPSQSYSITSSLTFGDTVRILKVIDSWANVRTENTARSSIVVEPSREWIHISLIQKNKPQRLASKRLPQRERRKPYSKERISSSAQKRIDFANSLDVGLDDAKVVAKGDNYTVLYYESYIMTSEYAGKLYAGGRQQFTKLGFHFVHFSDGAGLDRTYDLFP